MKTRKTLIIAILLAGSTQLSYAGNGELMNNIALIAILVMLILIAIVCFTLLNTFKVLASLLLPKETETVALTEHEYILEPTKPKVTLMEKLLSLRPLHEEKDMLINHEYDGIRELNNPIPAWFMWLFYISIIFAFTYLLNYHVFKLGKLQDEEYVVEMKQAEVDKKAFLAKSANRVDENSVKLSTDPEELKLGGAIYLQNCVACHGDKGQGIVGPNLTDEFWIHGSKIGDLFKVVKYGVPEKGMISWEKQLSPKQIADVTNYIKSLKGTNPPNPKAPQGEKES